MKTKIISLLALWTLFISFVFAWDLSSFIISVNPSTVKVWQPADITVKAVDSEWNIVDNYQWDILIQVMDWDKELNSSDYTAPNDWTYSFTAEDMWQKKFTKWLIINKPWDFKVRVEDFDTSKFWEWDIKVVAENSNVWDGKVSIITPQDWETITNDTLSLSATAKNYKNSKFQVLVDWKVVNEWLVDNNWNLQTDVTNLSNWKHTLKVQVLNLDGKVVAKSNDIKITVNVHKTLFKKIEILPWTNVDQWTKMTVNVTTDVSVSQAVLTIANYGTYPMDNIGIWKFTTQLVANTAWKFDVSLKLTSKDWDKTYSKIAKLVVLEHVWIQSVKFTRDNNEKKINLTWKFTWQVPMFKAEYWTWKWNYTKLKKVSENKVSIENIDPAKTYFVKITPIDSNWNKIWTASKDIVIESNMEKAASCTIDNIKTHVIIRWGNHYFVWSKAPGAVRYIVYKWTSITNLSEVATLTWTEYKFPFNAKAKKKEYAYFTVKAVCDDGTMKQIDKVKKVVVWPWDWLIYALVVAMMVFGLKLAYKEN